MTEHLVGSFDLDFLLEWYSRVRYLPSWRIESHSVILWTDKNNPFVYKSANMIHHETIPDLMRKVPEAFCVIALHECLTAYGRGRHLERNFPTSNDFTKNTDIDLFTVTTGKELKFQFEKKHVSDTRSFSFDNLCLEGMYESVYETVTVDFENKQLISSIIDPVETVDYHLLSGQ